MNRFNFTPIGHFNAPQKYTYEVPRQGTLNSTNKEAFIEIQLQDYPATQYLGNLGGFSHIWVTYIFHLNKGWKPLTQPPSLQGQKIGLFATRSPYRPNPIGLSLLKLNKIIKNKIYVQEYDLIDQTPILDIKPYLAYADRPQHYSQGWLDDPSYLKSNRYEIFYSEKAKNQMKWLKLNSTLCFEEFIQAQLSYWPKDTKNKRIKPQLETESPVSEKKVYENKVNKNENAFFEIAYRTWRIKYLIKEDLKSIQILKIYSGYTQEELLNQSENPYQDKQIHINFSKLHDK